MLMTITLLLAATTSPGILVAPGYSVDSGVPTELATDPNGGLLLSAMPPLVGAVAPASVGSIVAPGYSIDSGLPTQLATDPAGQLIISPLSQEPPYDNGSPTFLFVATTGNDGNVCISSGSPCLTIQGAVNKVPKLIRHPYIIKVAAGVYGAGAYVDGYTFSVSGANYTPSSDAGPYLAIEGTMVTAAAGGLMTGSIASATAGTGPNQGSCGPPNWSTFSVTGAGWTTNALTGLPICVTSGVYVGECSIIDKNTATVATLTGVWTLGTPSAGDTFQIQSWATVIDGGLPRPPGASGLQGYSPANANGFPAAFFVSGNQAQSFISGYGSGYFSDLTSTSMFANASYPEPQISINSFNFQNGDNMISVGASGPELIDFSHNSVSAGIAVNARGSSSVQIVGNASYQDAFGDFMYWNGAYGVSPVQMASSGALIASGNYCSQVSSGGYSNCFGVGGAALISQNVMTESDGQFTEYGAAYSSPNSTIHSVCNQYQNLLEGLSFTGFAINGTVFSSGDEFDTDLTAIHVSNFGKIELVTPNPVSNGTQRGILASAGSQVQLGGVSVAGLGDAGGDIDIDGHIFSYAYLVNDGGLVWNGVSQGINPGAFVNLQSGSEIFK